MEEWYIVYESFYYTSEYIKQIKETPSIVVWGKRHDEEKRKGDLLQINGNECMIKSKSLIFCQIYID